MLNVSNFCNKLPVIGVIYLAPSLGYKAHPGMSRVIDMAMEDLEIMKKCGVDGALLENEHDQPYTVLAGPEVIATMSITAHEIAKNCGSDIKLGVEFLINDPEASLSVAKASGASFIRTDYYVDRMSRDEYGGEMRIAPEEVLAFRKRINGDDIAIFSDIQVKYAKMLEQKTIEQSALDAKRLGSSGVIVSGDLTGVAPVYDDLRKVRDSGADIPIIIGSGANLDNVNDLCSLCDGMIVGTAFMTNTRMDYEKIAPFMDAINKNR